MAIETVFRLVVAILALFGLCGFLAVILDVLNQKIDRLEELKGEKND